MSSEVWKSSDLFNLLRAIAATKLALAETGEGGAKPRSRPRKSTTSYRQGCQLAIQSLQLAFGFSPQPFLDLEPDAGQSRSSGRPAWMRQDIQNIVASIYISFGSMRDLLTDTPETDMRYRGFCDVLISFLQAVGLSPELLEATQEQVPVPPRRWLVKK